jgi:hypothetical protein
MAAGTAAPNEPAPPLIVTSTAADGAARRASEPGRHAGAQSSHSSLTLPLQLLGQLPLQLHVHGL